MDMDTFSVEEAAQRLPNLISLAQQDNHLIRINSEEGNAILLSENTYHHLIVTLELLATPGLLDNLKANKCTID